MSVCRESLPDVQMLEDRLDLRRHGFADAQTICCRRIDERDPQVRRKIAKRYRGRGACGPRSRNQHVEIRQLQLAFTAYQDATTPAGLIGGGPPSFGGEPECGTVRTIEPTIAGTCCTPFGQAGTSQPS